MVKKALKKLFYIINLILYFVVIGLWIALPEDLTLNISTTSLALSLSLFLLIIDRDYYSMLYKSLKFKNLVTGLISACLLFCILSLLNYLFYKYPKTLDLSLFKTQSLTQETKKILASLDGPLEMILFADKGALLAQRLLTDLYRAEKNDFKIDFVDINLRPDLVQKYEITNSHMAALKYGTRSVTFHFDGSEATYTNAIVRASRDKDPIVYYVTGHGEASLEDMGPQGLSNLKSILEKTYFDIRELELISSSQVPSDASAIIILGPVQSFRESEIKVLDEYLKAGGALLVGLDPNFSHERLQNLKDLLAKREIHIQRNIIIERESFVDNSSGTVPIVDSFNEKAPITEFLNGVLFFPLVSSVEGGQSLLMSSPYPGSFTEPDLSEISRSTASLTAAYKKEEVKEENQGPFAFASLYEGKDSKEKIVAIGNASFVRNVYTSYGLQVEFFLNALSYLADDTIKSFTLSETANSPIFIGKTQMGLVFYFSVIFLPLILIVGAFFAYYRRIKL